MDWIITNWQSVAVGAIVAFTIAVFIRRFLRIRKGGARPPCGSHCDCPRKDL